VFLARKLVAYSRASGIDPFEPNAAHRIAEDVSARQLLSEVGTRFPDADPVAVLVLLLQSLKIEATEPRGNDAVVECVATLPQAYIVPTRPTRIVIREMLMAARRSVLAAGYLITEGSDLLSLAHAAACRGVGITLVCDRGRDEAQRIRSTWPSIAPQPRLFVNSQPDSPDGKMHAKVLVVDDHHLLVTSANFTWHGQEVNIEYGLRVSGEPARRTTLFFQNLEQLGVIVAVDSDAK